MGIDRKNMRVRFWVLLSSMLILIAGIAKLNMFAKGSGSGGGSVIKIATVISNQSPTFESLSYFKQLFEEKTGGRFDVQLFPGGQLGAEGDVINQVRRGDVQMTTSNPSLIDSNVTKLSVLQSYFLFNDDDHANKFWDGEGGAILMKSYRDAGLEGLTVFPLGFTNTINSKRSIRTLKDVEGLRLRGYNPLQIAAWESLGATLSTVDWNEIFTSLQQSLIDGAEVGHTSYYGTKFYEVAPYYSLTRHRYGLDVLVAGEKFMASLSEEDKVILRESLAEATTFHRNLIAEKAAEYIATFKEAGVTINEVPQEVRDAMSKEMNKAISSQIIAKTGQEFYDKILQYIEEAK